MSKELSKKAIEAGIIPAQAVKLLKMWKFLDEELPDTAKQEQTEAQLLNFVDELSVLLEATEVIPELRETLQDIHKQFEHEAKLGVVQDAGWVFSTRIMRDVTGKIILEIPEGDTGVIIHPGCEIIESVGMKLVILEVSPVYVGDMPKYIRCTVEEVPRAEV